MDRGALVSKTVLSVVRILIASYFLATATGLIFAPTGRTFFDAVLAADKAQLATTVYLFITAFAIMVGIFLRPAALLLAVYIFWSGFVHFDLGGSQQALSDYWRDMALLGAILLIAVTEPGGNKRFRLFARPVAPRRINRGVLPATKAAPTPRPVRRSAAPEAELSARMNEFILQDLEEDDDDTEVENLFTDLWEQSKPVPA